MRFLVLLLNFFGLYFFLELCFVARIVNFSQHNHYRYYDGLISNNIFWFQGFKKMKTFGDKNL